MGLFDLILIFIIGIVIFSIVTPNPEISSSAIEEKDIELNVSIKTGLMKDSEIKSNSENRYTTDEEIFIDVKIGGLENDGGESFYRIMYLIAEKDGGNTHYFYQNSRDSVPFKEGGGTYNEVIKLEKENFGEGNYTIILKVQDMKDKEIKEARQNFTIYKPPKNYFSSIESGESKELPPLFWISLIGILFTIYFLQGGDEKKSDSKKDYSGDTFRPYDTFWADQIKYERIRKQEEYRRREEERKKAEYEREREEERRKQEEYRRREEQYSRKKSQGHSDDIKNLLREFELDPYGNVGMKEIKEQYRYWAEMLHPDKNQNKSENTRKKAEEKLKRINQIYEKLNKYYNK